MNKSYQNWFFKKKVRSARMLNFKPQRKGIVVSLRVVTPRKPNSARRSAVKLRLTKYRQTVAYIPGSGHTLKKYSTVFIKGGGARDLPGVYCKCIRGVKDLKGHISKKKKRSKYGVKKSEYLAFVNLRNSGLT